MSAKPSNKRFLSLIAITISLMIFTAAVNAAGPGNAAQVRADKRQGMPQDAASATSGLDNYLKEILTRVNVNQQPDAELIEKALTHLKGCRTFLTKFTKPQVGEYYMLTAWVNHFRGDSKNALRAIQKAYKTYNQNFDVRASDTAISLLTGNKPSKPPKRPVTLEGEKILDLDTTSFRNDLLGRTVTPFQANCLNSTTFNYTPGQVGLCIMFWQLKENRKLDSVANPDDNSTIIDTTIIDTTITDSTITDPNRNPVAVKPEKPALKPNPENDRSSRSSRSNPDRGSSGRSGGRPSMIGVGNTYDTPTEVSGNATTLEEEMSAFRKLYLNTYGNENLKFLAINTGQPAELSMAINRLAESSWPWAQAMAKLPQSGTEQFADISVKKPTIVIVDKTGTIKYAGSTKGFLPKMILTKITGIQPASEPLQAATIEQTPPIRPQEQVQPVVPVVPVNPVQNNTPQELAPEDDFQAQKLIGAARDLFLAKDARKLITPKRGIELCRQIMKDYPNTKYDDEARTLLRENVDPRHRRRYNITDEEMGL
jgi:hypothetical protein